jgi:DNA polymerase-4
MARVIFHLDMDAFYASVEQRDHPEWRGKPVVVGAPPHQRGVVCAASYEARPFGVRSAMPSATAQRLCPGAVFARPRMDAYRNESHAIMELVRQVCGELIQQVSVDEAYVDVSGAFTEYASADAALGASVPLARGLKDAIRRNRGLTATIGVASNKLLAKIASDFKKPDGLTVIAESEKIEFLRPLPVRSLHGVGRVTERVLHDAGIRTIGDLQSYRGDLRALVGSWGNELRRSAFGEDERPLELGDDLKSISSETTFARDTSDRAVMRAFLREAAAEIAEKTARRRLAARTVQVKVRYGDFTTLTRQISVEEPVIDAREIYRLACWLLAHHRLVTRPLRLLGLGVSGLSDDTLRQLHLALAPLPAPRRDAGR